MKSKDMVFSDSYYSPLQLKAITAILWNRIKGWAFAMLLVEAYFTYVILGKPHFGTRLSQLNVMLSLGS